MKIRGYYLIVIYRNTHYLLFIHIISLAISSEAPQNACGLLGHQIQHVWYLELLAQDRVQIEIID